LSKGSGVRASEEEAFREYAAARMPALLRSAFLLTGGDWHQAEDVVSTAIGKLYSSWRRASQTQYLDAYVQRIFVRTWLDERRRPWRREHVVELVPEVGASVDDPERRTDLREILAALPSRQRAVLVLRFYEDLSVDQTADALDCTPGAVKTLTNRALKGIRRRLPGTLIELEDPYEQRSAHHAHPTGQRAVTGRD
jgi:RNA polymerase sigma-70 factor (sigma-E family)